MAKISAHMKAGRRIHSTHQIFSRQDHADKGDELAREHARLFKIKRRIQKLEESRLGASSGFDIERLGSLISGGIYANYSAKAKDDIRSLNKSMSNLKEDALAHYAAAGIPERAANPRFFQVMGNGKPKSPTYGMRGIPAGMRTGVVSQRSLDKS